MDSNELKTVEFPVIRENELIVLGDNAYYGITEQNKESEAAKAINEFAGNNESLKSNNPYDFRGNTSTPYLSWSVQDIGGNSINVFQNSKVTDENAIVVSEKPTGFEKVFWFNGIKS